ncbi:MAG: DMT family transporter [Pseudomonadota bacterium]
MTAPILLYGPLVVTVMMWAFQAPALHALGDRWDPATLNIVRYLVAMVAFAVIARLTPGGRTETRERLAPAQGALVGGLFASFGLLFATGSVLGNPVVTATATALAPLTASLVTWVVMGQRPARPLILALVLVVPGAILAMPAPEGTGGDRPVVGLALVILAQICWSLYSLAVPRLMPATSTMRRSWLSIQCALPFHLALFLLCWSVGLGRADPSYPVFDAGVTLAAALGPLVLGLMLWNLSVARLGLPVCALFLNCVPVTGTLIAWAFGTVPTAQQFAGVALVMLGMGMAQYRRRDTTEGRSPLPRS